MQLLASILMSLLKTYLVKLATQEFANYVFFEVAKSIVESTETTQDDKWLAKIKETIEK